jgi:hypothetical protein
LSELTKTKTKTKWKKLTYSNINDHYKSLCYSIQVLNELYLTIKLKGNLEKSPYKEYASDLNKIATIFTDALEIHGKTIRQIETTLKDDEILEEGRRSGKISGGVRSRSRRLHSPIRRR